MVGCLLTTQQKAGPGYPVNRFLNLDPFPLKYAQCNLQEDLEAFTLNTLQTFGGIRMAPTISIRTKENFDRLKGGLYKQIDSIIQTLEKDRNKRIERTAARTIDIELIGFGPKQSRNLLQWLGSSVYEIPIDSRLIKWISENLSLTFFNPKRLSNLKYYENVLDLIQQLCESADVLPCLFDAAVFSSFDEEDWTASNLRSSMLIGA